MSCCAFVSSAFWPIAKRQLGSFLANPLGYIFILLFVVICAVITFLPDDYYKRNLCDFGNLYGAMTWVLTVFIPLLAMNAWSSEKESGTEELLLTLPVTLADAVFGKALAIGAFFTLAMICNLTNVWGLTYLGEPDLGLIGANLLGWWLLGLSYIPIALCASMLVTSPAIAAVLGIIGTLIASGLVVFFDLLAPFNNGTISLGSMLFFVGFAVIGFAACFFILASRRWRDGQENLITAQVATVLLAVVLAVNLGLVAKKLYWDADISQDHLASVGSASAEMARELPQAATITLFLTHDEELPQSMAGKVREVLAKAQALQAAAPTKVRLEIRRPHHQYDEAGTEATDEFGIQPRPVRDASSFTTRNVRVFCGAAITCAEQTETVPFFEAGQSVEYELIRNLRAVARKAAPRATATVTIYAAKGLAEARPDLLDEARTWVADHAGVETIQASLVEVEDGTEQTEGLEAHLVEWERVVPASATPDGEAAPEGDEAAAAGDEAAAADDEAAPAGEEPAASTETVSRNLLFGAVVQTDSRRIRVPWLGDGGVGSSLREAIDKARINQPVLGVLGTDLQITGGWDQASMRSQPEWALLSEWRRHFDVREIAPDELDVAAQDDVDVLLAALPSSLTQEQLERLYHWVWSGKPTIILDDPNPYFAYHETKTVLAPAAAKPPKQPPQPGMPPQPNPEKKVGDHGMRGFLQAFGIDCDLRRVWWSKHNPAVDPRLKMPEDFVWVDAAQGMVNEDPITEGIGVMLLPMPGAFSVLKGSGLTVKPLLSLRGEAPRGYNEVTDYYNDLNAPPQYIFPQLPDPSTRKVVDDTLQRHFAAQISGTAKHLYGTADVDKDAPSPRPVNLVFIADTDCLHSQFFHAYKAYGSQVDRGDADADIDPILSKLRNVQFMENILDHQVGDELMIELRSRWATQRSLTSLDEKRAASDQARFKLELAFTEQVQERIEEINADIQKQVDDKGGSLSAQEQLALLQRLQAQANDAIRAENAKLDNKQVALDVAQNKEMRGHVNQLKRMVLLVPLVLIGALVVIVALIRVARERAQVPAARERRS